MAKGIKRAEGENAEQAPEQGTPVCGLIMPISAMLPEYDERHWVDVRQVLEQAIRLADMRPQMVSDSFETDVIHRRIVQNLYENPVVVCDVSGLNPNVMFELGMRVTFKKPVVVVTDNVTRPPFDTGVIEYLPYPVSLHIHDTNSFVERLTERIKVLHEQSKSNSYTSFMETFGRFEVLTPSTENVEPLKYFTDRMDELANSVRRLERGLLPYDLFRKKGMGTISPHSAVSQSSASSPAMLPSGTLKELMYVLPSTSSEIMALKQRLETVKGVLSVTVTARAENYVVAVHIEPLAHSATESKINEIIVSAGGFKISG